MRIIKVLKCHLAIVRNCGGSEMILVKPKMIQDCGINLDSNSIQLDSHYVQLQLNIHFFMEISFEVEVLWLQTVDMVHMNLTNCTIYHSTFSDSKLSRRLRPISVEN